MARARALLEARMASRADHTTASWRTNANENMNGHRNECNAGDDGRDKGEGGAFLQGPLNSARGVWYMWSATCVVFV